MKKCSPVFAFVTVALLCCTRGFSASYTTALIPPQGQDFLAWCFQTNSLDVVFPVVEDGTTVDIMTNGSYISSTYFGGYWTPNLMLYPGVGFWIISGATNARTYTVSGTLITNSYFSLPLTNADQWYGVCNAYLASDVLECISNRCGQPYTHQSLQYHSTTNDLVYQWDVVHQQWQEYKVIADYCLSAVYTNLTVTTSNIPYGESPGLCAGKGIFIYPAIGKTWFQYRDQTNRCCDGICTNTASCP